MITRTINKKGLFSRPSTACAIPDHPYLQNGTNPFLNPLGASSPCLPSRAHLHPRGTALMLMKPRPRIRGGSWLAVEEKESEVSRIMEGYDNSEGSDSIEYVGVKRVLESGLSINKVHWRMKRRSHVIWSHILIWLMWAEERTYNRCVELMAMQHVDPHNCSNSHHKCIQHWVEVPMYNQKLNKYDHAARRQPLKMTRKHESERYKIS